MRMAITGRRECERVGPLTEMMILGGKERRVCARMSKRLAGQERELGEKKVKRIEGK